MQDTQTVTFPGMAKDEGFVMLPDRSITKGKRLTKEDVSPESWARYEKLLKDNHISGEPVIYLDVKDKSTKASVSLGTLVDGRQPTVLVINDAEHEWTPEYVRRQAPAKSDLDASVKAHAFADGRTGSRGEKKYYAEFEEALRIMGGDPATEVYFNKAKVTGPHSPVVSAMTQEGTPYVVLNEPDLKKLHWNAAQFENVAGHEVAHNNAGDNKPDNVARVHNDRTHTLSRAQEQRADDKTVDTMQNPAAFAEALQIGMNLDIKAYKKETGKTEQDYYNESQTLDPLHNPVKERIDTLNKKAASLSKPR